MAGAPSLELAAADVDGVLAHMTALQLLCVPAHALSPAVRARLRERLPRMHVVCA